MRISDWSSDVCSSDLKVDPMHQFEVQKMFDMFHVGNHQVAFTTSAMWMVIAGLLLWVFMIGGMKRQLVPGRWQVAVEGFTGFISSMMNANIGPEGRKYTHYVLSLLDRKSKRLTTSN